MHVLPPHPGPVAATELYDANLGLVLLVGVPVWSSPGTSGCSSSPALGEAVPGATSPGAVREINDGRDSHGGSVRRRRDLDHDHDPNPPSVGTVVAVLLLPLILIFMNTGLDAASRGRGRGEAVWVQALTLLRHLRVALLISVLVAAIVLGTRRARTAMAA